MSGIAVGAIFGVLFLVFLIGGATLLTGSVYRHRKGGDTKSATQDVSTVGILSMGWVGLALIPAVGAGVYLLGQAIFPNASTDFLNNMVPANLPGIDGTVTGGTPTSTPTR